MLLAKTRKTQNSETTHGGFGTRFRDSKVKITDPSENDLEDGDVEMTLDEQIESLERMQKLIRQLAAEQGVFLKDDNE